MDTICAYLAIQECEERQREYYVMQPPPDLVSSGAGGKPGTMQSRNLLLLLGEM